MNAEQKDAIDATESVFLIACPGSGKTRTLTYKIADELSRIESHREFVAAITYTHRAADEMEERIGSLGVDTTQLWIGTIHAFCLEWILKPYGLYHPRLRQGFHVINSYETEVVMERLCMDEPGISIYDCGYFFTESGLELACQQEWKHTGVRRVLQSYFDELRDSRQIDYEQILLFAYELVRDNSAIARVLSSLFSFIAIDEFQDTKQIQYAILGAILRSGAGRTRTMVVGDPNQAIFASLGGYPMAVDDFRELTGIPISEMALSRNYRSSGRLIEYFENFNVHGTRIEPASLAASYPSIVSLNVEIDRVDLEAEIIRLVRHNIEVLGVPPHEICVVAPWWIHLAHMTRKLVALLPEYEFDGPGLVPFSRDLENFWYKLAKLALTEASPQLFGRRQRWAAEVISDLSLAGADTRELTTRGLLRWSNSIHLDEKDGLEYLRLYFAALFDRMGIERNSYQSLSAQYDAFFSSTKQRVDRLEREGAAYISDIETFKRVFRTRSGITVSTIHGIKGAEFDSVIGFALLDGMVPHFSDADQLNSAKKLLYVLSSRAKKNLHLIAERGRPRGRSDDYETSVPLRRLAFKYNELSWQSSPQAIDNGSPRGIRKLQSEAVDVLQAVSPAG